MIAWFTRHAVAANLLMVILLIGGYLSASTMRKEIIPKLPVSTVTISVSYDGRTAKQVDNEVGQKIEQALEGVAGIEHIELTSSQDQLSVTISKKLDYNIDRLVNDIKNRVDNIYDWPMHAEKPQVQRVEETYSALMVQLYGDTDDETLLDVGQRIKQSLLANPAIHKIETHSAANYHIYINIEPDMMKQYQLTFSDIADAIRQQSVRSKSGLLKTDNGQFLIYSEQHARQQRDFEQLVVKIPESGGAIYLSDIASINDDFVEHDSTMHFNGQATIAFEIKMSAESDVLEIAKQTKKVVAQLNPTLPDNLQLITWFDASTYVQDRLNLLQNSAFQGFVLVILLLGLFLQVRLAFWVAMGLPVAIAGTFIVLSPLGFDYTINEITTFGFILVLGILVDDAVVVGESIYASKEEGGDPLQATINGVHKVAIPTIFGVLTTVAALVPMTQFPSETGRLFASFAWVVIAALLFSLLESKFILPAHLRHLKTHNPIRLHSHNNGEHKPTRLHQCRYYLSRLRHSPKNVLQWFAIHLYQPTLRFVIRYRYAWFICFLSLSLAVLGALYQGKIRSTFFPDVPGNFIVLTAQLEDNAPLVLVQQAMSRVEQLKVDINQKFRHAITNQNDLIEKALSIQYEQGYILVFAELVTKDHRQGVDIEEIAKQWRTPLSHLAGIVSVEAEITEEGTSSGTHVILQHPDADVLNDIVAQSKVWLKERAGVRNIKDSENSTTPQFSFKLKPHAHLYGITPQMLANQLSAAYGGIEVDRFNRGEHRVKVTLTLPRPKRNSRSDFDNMVIFNGQLESFPLTAIADVTLELVNNSFTRYDGKLSRHLEIDIDKNITSPEWIYQQLLTHFQLKIRSQYPQFTLVKAGELEETSKSKKGLRNAFIIAFIIIYVLLALPLKRYAQPLIIMSAIPFGMVGALLAHIWLDLAVSIYSFLAVLALSGVVINDSLLIVTRYNDIRTQVSTPTEAVIAATTSRFRAIFLTTVTTFIGLYPLLNETSEQAQYLIPAAASMAYGLLFATLITLFLIPVLLLICRDIKAFLTE